jgi:hypothetical protein
LAASKQVVGGVVDADLEYRGQRHISTLSIVDAMGVPSPPVPRSIAAYLPGMQRRDGEYVFVILSGSAKVTRNEASGGASLLALRGRGGIVGDMCRRGGGSVPCWW